MKNILTALAITVAMTGGNAALAHEDHDGDDHGGGMQQGQGMQNNQQHGTTVSRGNTQAWQSAWTQPNNPNYGYYQNYQSYYQKHPTDHRVLEQSEAQYHQLLQQGRITQQEHQMLDAQLRAQHAQKDASVQNNFNRYGYPYANQKMPKLINKLTRILNY